MQDRHEPAQPDGDRDPARAPDPNPFHDPSTAPGTPCPYAAVLAGGSSRRMGRDKADLPFGAATLLERAADLAAALARRVIIVGRRPSAPMPPTVDHVSDAWPGKGPLGGIATALETTRPDACLILPCDMPLLTVGLLKRLIGHHARGSSDVTLLAHPSGEGIEPLVGVYESGCLSVMRTSLQAGALAIRYSLDRLSVRPLRIEPAEMSQLVNVNTPDDLAGLGG